MFPCQRGELSQILRLLPLPSHPGLSTEFMANESSRAAGMPERLAYRHARWLILAAVALLGVAHSALLPPFEEYDSIQYWSGIQQVADTGTIPLRGVARLSADLDFYDGPRTFDSAPGQPPSGMTYRAFFSRP